MTGHDFSAFGHKAYGRGWQKKIAGYLGITDRHVRNLASAEQIPVRYEKALLGLKIAVDNAEQIS